MTGITGRDMDQKGSKAVSKMWSDFTRPFQQVLKEKTRERRRAPAAGASQKSSSTGKVQASHQAANVFAGTGTQLKITRE